MESCGSSANDPVSRPTLVTSRPTIANQNITKELTYLPQNSDEANHKTHLHQPLTSVTVCPESSGSQTTSYQFDAGVACVALAAISPQSAGVGKDWLATAASSTGVVSAILSLLPRKTGNKVKIDTISL